MSASINELALPVPVFPYDDPYFQTVVLRSYLDLLIGGASVQTLNNLDTYKYAGDFYGILNNYQIPLQYHPIILRMNGFTDPTDYDTTITTILIPNFSDIDQIANTYSSTIAETAVTPNPLNYLST
jgi:hypothetical protein